MSQPVRGKVQGGFLSNERWNLREGLLVSWLSVLCWTFQLQSDWVIQDDGRSQGMGTNAVVLCSVRFEDTTFLC